MDHETVGLETPFKYYEPSFRYQGEIDAPPPALSEMKRWERQIAAGQDRGHVYILGTSDGYYKIGKTNKISRRIKQLSIQLPFRVRTMYAADVYNITVVEREWHRQFADKRMNGEWFRLTDEDVRYALDYSAYAGFSEISWVQKLLDFEWQRRCTEWVYVLALSGNKDAQSLIRETIQAQFASNTNGQ